jgi:manganese/zinc-transporting P-type ATPase C
MPTATLPPPLATCQMRLLSKLPGRQRWYIPGIHNRPRMAAGVERVLRKEPSLLGVHVNFRTGRILLQWDPQQSIAIQSLLRKALTQGPIDNSSYLELRDKPDAKVRNLVRKLALGCFKLSLILFSRLFWGAAAAGPLAGPIQVLSIFGIVITGYDFLRAFYRALVGQSGITTGTLIGVATLSSMALRENVTALTVLWLLNLGEYLEMVTLRRTRAAIRSLLSTDDEDIWVIVGDVEVMVPIKQVQPGASVMVRPGRRIPIDGVIESGDALVNEAPITGESMPVARQRGDAIYAGTVLLVGTIRVRVTGTGSDTVVGKMIERVERAQALRPEIQKVGDRFAKTVVPASFIFSSPVPVQQGWPLQQRSVPPLETVPVAASWSRAALTSRRWQTSTPSSSTRPEPSPIASPASPRSSPAPRATARSGYWVSRHAPRSARNIPWPSRS